MKNKRLIAAVARLDQAKAKAEFWKSQLPNYFRTGDVLLINPEGITRCPGFQWMLLRQHIGDTDLWYACIVDDRDTLVGASDRLFEGALYGGQVARPTIGTWVHEKDLCLSNRMDHASKIVVSDCLPWVGKIAPELLSDEDDEIDGDYDEHMQDLRAWESLITEMLHTKFPHGADIIREAVEAYWENFG